MTLWNLLGLLLVLGAWPSCYWLLSRVFIPGAPGDEAGQPRTSADQD